MESKALKVLERFPPELWICIAEATGLENNQQWMSLVFYNSQYRFPRMQFDAERPDWDKYLDTLLFTEFISLACPGCNLPHATCGSLRSYHRPLCAKAKKMWKPFPNPQAGFALVVPKVRFWEMWVLQSQRAKAKYFNISNILQGIDEELDKINRTMAKQIEKSASSDGRHVVMRILCPEGRMLAEVSTERTLSFRDVPDRMDTGRTYLWRCCPKASKCANLFHGCFEFCDKPPTLDDWCHKCATRNEASDLIKQLVKNPGKGLVSHTLWSGTFRPTIFKSAGWNCDGCNAQHFIEYKMSDKQRLAGQLTLRTGMRRAADGLPVTPRYQGHITCLED